MRVFRFKNHNLSYSVTLVFIIASMAILGPGMAYAKNNQPMEKIFSKSVFAMMDDDDRDDFEGHGDWNNLGRHDRYDHNQRACSNTTRPAYKACLNEVRDDAWISLANCQNISAADEKAECIGTAAHAFQEAGRLCSEQRYARAQVCERLGEAPHDPVIPRIWLKKPIRGRG